MLGVAQIVIVTSQGTLQSGYRCHGLMRWSVYVINGTWVKAARKVLGGKERLFEKAWFWRQT